MGAAGVVMLFDRPVVSLGPPSISSFFLFFHKIFFIKSGGFLVKFYVVYPYFIFLVSLLYVLGVYLRLSVTMFGGPRSGTHLLLQSLSCMFLFFDIWGKIWCGGFLDVCLLEVYM